MHRIFIRGKRREYVIADSALICVQVHAWSFWFDADEHHPGFALRTGGSLKCNRRWNGGRRALRLGHNASPTAAPAQAGRERGRAGSQLGQRFVTHHLIAADGYGSCAKNGPKCRRRHQGATNLTGPRLLPRGRLGIGEQGIERWAAMLVPTDSPLSWSVDEHRSPHCRFRWPRNVGPKAGAGDRASLQ